jgi:hypothetical protein
MYRIGYRYLHRPGRWGLYGAWEYANEPLALPMDGWWLHFSREDSAGMLTAAVANILLRPVTLESAWAKFTMPAALKFAVKEPVYFVRRGIAFRKTKRRADCWGERALDRRPPLVDVLWSYAPAHARERG